MVADPLPIAATASAPSPIAAPAAPFSALELQSLLRRPDRTFDLLLGRRDRLAATIGDERPPWRLCLVLLACTAMASLPYGIVLGGTAAWKVAALFGGSVLLCWPSLQVFGSYLGSTLLPAQSLALSLVIACVASLFTLGFCPILWFLKVTMENGDRIDADDASRCMLAIAMVAGLLQLVRCTAQHATLRLHHSMGLLVVWQVLVVFVVMRMARTLGLLP